MKLLLDTNALLLGAEDGARLRPSAADAVTDPSNELYVSTAAVWEIMIKCSSGKLQLTGAPSIVIPRWMDALGARDLAIEPRHVLALGTLPRLHGDPFDRIMIAQALVDGLTIVTSDATVRAYPVASIAS